MPGPVGISRMWLRSAGTIRLSLEVGDHRFFKIPLHSHGVAAEDGYHRGDDVGNGLHVKGGSGSEEPGQQKSGRK